MNVQAETWPRPHRLTVHDFRRMAEVGVLAPDTRVELVEGAIVDMAPIGHLHSAAVIQLNHRLVHAVGSKALVSVQGPLRLGTYTELVPDFTVLRLRDYRTGVPTAADVLLAVEVSDTTLRFDRGTKARLYAQAGIATLWVADVNRRRLHVFTKPKDGVYQDEAGVAPGVMPLPGLDISIDVTDAI